MAEEEKKVSKFSSGLNILMRLDELWKNCLSFKRNGLYYKWNDELDSVWLELVRDLKPEEYYDLDKDGKPLVDSKKLKDKIDKKGYKTQFEEFDSKLRELLPFSDSGTKGFGNPSNIDMKNRNNQYKVLMEKHRFLARLENELGKGTSWEEEDEDF